MSWGKYLRAAGYKQTFQVIKLQHLPEQSHSAVLQLHVWHNFYLPGTYNSMVERLQACTQMLLRIFYPTVFLVSQLPGSLKIYLNAAKENVQAHLEKHHQFKVSAFTVHTSFFFFSGTTQGNTQIFHNLKYLVVDVNEKQK